MPKEGDICRAINSSGQDSGLAIFVEKIPPHTLSQTVTDFYMLWNMKVLMQGEIRYLDTNNWTLIPVSEM